MALVASLELAAGMFRQLVRIGQSLSKLDVQTNYRQIWLKSQNQITKQCSSEVIEDLPDVIKSLVAKEHINQPPGHKKALSQLALKGRMNRLWSTRTSSLARTAVIKIPKDVENCENSNDRSTKYLIIVSTIEQAKEMADVFKGLKSLGIESIVLDGRGGVYDSDGRSFKDYDVYIATPDGLMEFIQAEEIDLSSIKYLIFDGADQMHEFGIKPQVMLNALSRISSGQELSSHIARNKWPNLSN